ncbi:hypothetical protein HPB47_023270 [Ixodes persulcatus]|uniref:Uncharacterized protein n=1 Tax=Ixodes persulcatus TaxID=34615 RepID=A0AC60Q7H8_IXOPE|nr:hypothetical protein HPB47_023270 [Ixodes persulcatus]
MRQHKNDVRKLNHECSAVAEHCEVKDHRIDFDNTSIIDAETNNRHRLFIESWHIQTTPGNIKRCLGALPTEFLDNGQGHVSGIRTVQVKWTKDATGRWNMEEVPDTSKVFKADLVLLAMGFLGPEKYLIDELSLEQDPRCNIRTPAGRTAPPSIGSTRPEVGALFAAPGNCRKGQSLVVHAINEGRQAAREIDRDLTGKSVLAGPGGVITHVSELIVGS